MPKSTVYIETSIVSYLTAVGSRDLVRAAHQVATRLVRDGGLPAKAQVDAFHVASATAHGIDYLLTWNCKHIANASLRGKIESICKAAGYQPSTICTPFELPKD